MKNIKIIGLLISMFLIYTPLYSQLLSYDHSIEVILNDGTNIRLYKTVKGKKYYYLPPSQSLKLSEKKDGTPEFLFLKYTTEDRQDAGGVQGAIMHFLFEWGLTPAQFKELGNKVKSKHNGGIVKGPVDLIADEKNSFQIVSAILTDKDFTPNFTTSGKAPPMPGSKAAVAAKLDKNGAQLLAATFEKSRSISDVSLALNYQYTLGVQAAKGKITYNWTLLQSQSEGLAYDYLRKELDGEPEQFAAAKKIYDDMKEGMEETCGVTSGLNNLMVAAAAADAAIGNTSGGGTGGVYEYGVTESMMRKIYEHIEENEVVKLEWQETIADERLDAIRAAFFDYFLNAFTDQDFPELIDSDRTATAAPENNLKEHAEGVYSFKSCSEISSDRVKNKTIKLDNIILPVKRSYQMVTNLASTYDMVKNNKKCVSTINLNDKFFLHRDMNFILDLEAEEMFGEEVNYVTVNVRKRRNKGSTFEDAITIDRTFLANKGTLAKLTYARGEDNNPSLYEYKTQWSLKGGKIYPTNPRWIKGDWQGVTLAAPIKPRTIEFEGNLEEMTEQKISRATLQVRYLKFGKETETNIPLTISKGTPLVEKMIFTDADQTGYAYRIILNHTQKGKMATDWEAKYNDDYVYANLPKKFLLGDENFIQKMIKAAQEMVKPEPDGTVKSFNTVLDKILKGLDIILGE